MESAVCDSTNEGLLHPPFLVSTEYNSNEACAVVNELDANKAENLILTHENQHIIKNQVETVNEQNSLTNNLFNSSVKIFKAVIKDNTNNSNKEIKSNKNGEQNHIPSISFKKLSVNQCKSVKNDLSLSSNDNNKKTDYFDLPIENTKTVDNIAIAANQLTKIKSSYENFQELGDILTSLDYNESLIDVENIVAIDKKKSSKSSRKNIKSNIGTIQENLILPNNSNDEQTNEKHVETLSINSFTIESEYVYPVIENYKDNTENLVENDDVINNLEQCLIHSLIETENNENSIKNNKLKTDREYVDKPEIALDDEDKNKNSAQRSIKGKLSSVSNKAIPLVCKKRITLQSTKLDNLDNEGKNKKSSQRSTSLINRKLPLVSNKSIPLVCEKRKTSRTSNLGKLKIKRKGQIKRNKSEQIKRKEGNISGEKKAAGRKFKRIRLNQHSSNQESLNLLENNDRKKLKDDFCQSKYNIAEVSMTTR